MTVEMTSRNVALIDQLAATARDNTPHQIAKARRILAESGSRSQALAEIALRLNANELRSVAALAADLLLRLAEQPPDAEPT